MYSNVGAILHPESSDSKALIAVRFCLPLHEEDGLPEAPMRVHPEEALAEGDEAGNMEDGIWGKSWSCTP